MSGSNPYEWFQDLVGQVPELVQPFVVALAGAIPYIEGEGSAALGVFAGIHPVVAGISGAVGNIIAVVLVVLLSSRARATALARRSRRPGAAALSTDEQAHESERAEKQSNGHKRLRRLLVRFGVPGASLLGPLALPTHLTAATLVATGVSKRWVILWQVIAIVLWAALLTLAATGLVTVIEAE
ncbi:small multidrug efflux protein [Kribbella soli]|uniref:Small multidrug efflux protein n=1 Tax=Kribbella soli TaxID=1124743 RepID=A0A4R0H9S1_9ACTN|nr:small multidrug efflux protein [Kribbella soli]TCC06254.1 small multidrug efflux protein [Kribbella soli]